MILTAAIALALTLDSLVKETYVYQTLSTNAAGGRRPFVLWNAVRASPSLLACTVALLICRLGAPRPSWRHILRQPGTMACLMIVGTLLYHGLFLGLSWCLARAFGKPRSILWGSNFLMAGPESGHTVLWAWATMALTSTWRPEPSWVDRGGRCLGLVVILIWIGRSLNI